MSMILRSSVLMVSLAAGVSTSLRHRRDLISSSLLFTSLYPDRGRTVVAESEKEANMERQDHLEAELIDLGTVIEETKGPGPVGLDFLGPQQTEIGLSDD